MGSFLMSKTHIHDTHLHTPYCEQKADLEGVSREEMYAPPEHAAPATPLRDDVVTEGVLVGSWDGFWSGTARVCVCVWTTDIYLHTTRTIARSLNSCRRTGAAAAAVGALGGDGTEAVCSADGGGQGPGLDQ